MSFSRGDRTVFAVEDVEIQTIQAKIKDDNDEAAAHAYLHPLLQKSGRR